MDESILVAKELTRKVGDLVLLDRISLTVSHGDRIALVGPSGSGKTVLLRALAMLDPLDHGEILWKGKLVVDSSVPQYRSRAIYVHQRPALFEGTVEDNLKTPFLLRVHRNKQFNRQQAVGQLEMLGREESFLNKAAHNISGGESQLTALLRATQLDPDILFLDEPTAALDDQATAMVETFVANWLNDKNGRRAIIWVTHDQKQAQRISNKIWRIEKGKVT